MAQSSPVDHSPQYDFGPYRAKRGEIDLVDDFTVVIATLGPLLLQKHDWKLPSRKEDDHQV